jgi:hypothetical protein
MTKHFVTAAVMVMMVLGLTAPVSAIGQIEATARNAYRMILSEVDADKDGKMTVKECMSIYKDKDMATKNCTFWDANKDGVITEDEYVKQGMSLGKKK